MHSVNDQVGQRVAKFWFGLEPKWDPDDKQNSKNNSNANSIPDAGIKVAGPKDGNWYP